MSDNNNNNVTVNAADLAAMLAKLEALEKQLQSKKKNQVQGVAKAGKMYVRLTDEMATYGKVPQQQADLAKIIKESTEKDVPISEQELFAALVEKAQQYPSLRQSVQDPTYLFRYYRGLDRRNNKHFGFVRRGFLKEV